MSRLPALILTAVVVAVLVPASASAQTDEGLGAQSFAVDVVVAPDFPPPPAVNPFTDCGNIFATFPNVQCTNTVQVNTAAKQAVGTSTELTGKKRKGRFELGCDWVLPVTVGTDVGFANIIPAPGTVPSPTSISLRSFDGSGPIGCSWSMAFGDGDVLAGVVDGTLVLSRVPDQQAVLATVNLNFEVIAGSGIFVRATGGKGTLTRTQQTPWTSGTGLPTRALAARILADAAADAGRMRMVIKAGKRRAKIVPMKRALRPDDARTLRVAAPPRSSCTAKAVKGSTKVSLGSARDKKARGEVRFSGRLAQKLSGTGTWTVTATCKVRRGGKTLKVPATTAKVSRVAS
jgi:hypothetical protein